MIGYAILYRTGRLTCMAGRYNALHVRNVWTNPLSKFLNRSLMRDDEPLQILEQPETTASPSEKQLIADLKHYLRTGDIPSKLRQKILANKILIIANWPDQYSPALIDSIDSIFSTVYSLHNQNIDLFLSLSEQILLFSNSAKLLQLHLDRKHFPQYAYLLIQNFLRQDANKVPTEVLVQMVQLGVVTRGLEMLLQALLRSYGPKLTPHFSKHLIEAQQSAGSLSLVTFQMLASNLSRYHLVDENIILTFQRFIEEQFSAEPPRAHEYTDPHRNLDGIVHVANNFFAAKDLDTASLLNLMKLMHDLLSVTNNSQGQKTLIRAANNLFANPDQGEWIEAKQLLFAQSLGDEDLLETVLLLAWSNPEYLRCATDLSDFVEQNDVKFSLEMRCQAQIYKIVSIKPTNESQIANNVLQILREYREKDIVVSNEMFSKTVQCAMASGSITPTGDFVTQVRDYFNLLGIETPLQVYKILMDAGISRRNYVDAMTIFEGSVLEYADWSNERDPTILKTLNDLIILSCESLADVTRIFPVFIKIKQQMSSLQCNAEAITSLASQMLDAEYVGDLIEMLKRELPEITPDTWPKLPMKGPAGAKYLDLFKVLHTFIVEYTGESTYETNWVLYGELHKYFEVPFDSYLPAMKYFCEHDRANAALIIFRQVRKLHELHGHQFHAPLREMYVYLLQQFGDKLYEEGVIEVHEHLKTDIMLPQQDIHLQNAILNAYSNLQDVARARDLFLAMSSKPKMLGGVNEETIQIMIKTYTYNDLGYVKHFWNNLSQFGIVPDNAIYQQYVIAHVYHGLANEAISLIEEMDEYGLIPSSELLCAAHNFCFDKTGQKTIAEWCQKSHPQLWDQALKNGSLVGATNYMPTENLIAGSGSNHD